MSTTRKVTIVSTKNNKVKFYETAATTWGELNAEINKDFDLSNLKATENVNKTTLEHVDAVLPEGEFRVFLRPTKTKSGNHDFDSMKFGDLRATFKDDEEAKKFLSSFKKGKNWTQLKTDELKEGLKIYYSSVKIGSIQKVVQEVIKEEEAIIEEIKQEFEAVELNTLEKFQTAMNLLQEVSDEISDSGHDEDEEYIYKLQEFIDENEDEVEDFLKQFSEFTDSTTSTTKSAPVEKVETEEDRIKREAQEVENKEIADALKEAQDFSSGFTN